MFNNPKIHIFNKLLCLLLYSLVIIFNTSSISLLLLFIIFFVMIKEDTRMYSMIISMAFVFAFALLYIFDVTVWVKLILLIAYIYYFLYLDINNLPKKKKTVIVTESKVDKEELKKDIEDKVDKELEKGNTLTEEQKEHIKERLDSKVENEYKRKSDNYLMRYYNIQTRLARRKYSLTGDNISFLLIHIILLLVCVFVEKL